MSDWEQQRRMKPSAWLLVLAVGCSSDDATRRVIPKDAGHAEGAVEAAAGQGGEAGAVPDADASGIDASAGASAGEAGMTGADGEAGADAADAVGDGGDADAAETTASDATDAPVGHGACWEEPLQPYPTCHNPCAEGAPLSTSCGLQCDLAFMYGQHPGCFYYTWGADCVAAYIVWCGCGSC